MASEMLESLITKPIEDWYGTTVDVPIQLLKPDSKNLRDEFDEDDLLDLGRNILSIGQLDEITIFPIIDNDGGWTGLFDLHDGERRWRAANLVGLSSLKAKIVSRPSDEELVYKKISRVLQTRTLNPDKKVNGLAIALEELGVFNHPDEWDSYRDKLGGGPEWPQLIRVLLLDPRVRSLMDEGTINFTVAQSIGRLPQQKQGDIAEFVVTNKINGRFFSTQMVPFLLENPEASPAQAFEHTRVGDWRQYSKSPYERGHEPSIDEGVDEFLEACVKWERAWEVVVHTGLVGNVNGDANLEYRLRDSANRVAERATALSDRIAKQSTSDGSSENISTPQSLPSGKNAPD